jgi:hypothetical protein
VPFPGDIDDGAPRHRRQRRGPGWARRPDRGRIAAIVAGLLVVLLAVVVAVIGGERRGADTDTAATVDLDRSAGATGSTAPGSTSSPTSATTSSSTTTVPPAATTAPPPPPAPPSTPAPTAPPPPPAPAVAAAPAPAAADVPGTGALCVGDSVMLGASSTYFGTITMCGQVDAVVGRQVSAGAGALRSHGPFPGTVVIHLGTNGPTDAGQLDDMLGVVAGVSRVVLVNVQLNGTRAWESSVNAELAAAAGRWPNVHLADWYAASAGHPDYFRDGIHLTSAGAHAYAATIAAAL